MLGFMAIRDLEKKLLLARDATERLGVLLELADAQAASGARPTECLRATREAVGLARANGDTGALVRAMGIATRCHLKRGDPAGAIATSLDALEACAHGDLSGKSQALHGIACALFNVGAHVLAVTAAQGAVDAALEAHDDLATAAAREALGNILRELGAGHCAREELRQAAGVFRQRGELARVKALTAQVGHSYRDQGNAAAAAGKEAQARLHWKQSLRIYRVALYLEPVPADDALLWVAIADCELRMGHHAMAAAAIERALAQGVGTPTVTAACRLGESAVLQGRGDLAGAMRACTLAREAAEQLQETEWLVRCLMAESKLADLHAKFERATDLERRARALEAERAAAMARLRAEIAPLWERHRLPPESTLAQVA